MPGDHSKSFDGPGDNTPFVPSWVLEQDRDRRDAARYRWLRDNGHIKFLCYGQEVDDLVDAEMAKPPVQLEI
jgi:hypothetical protein